MSLSKTKENVDKQALLALQEGNQTEEEYSKYVE